MNDAVLDFDVLTYDGLADPACCEKYLKDNKHNSLNLALKICSDMCPWTLSVPRSEQFPRAKLEENCELRVFLELRSRKTVRISEQMMSADKYPSIFSRQMKAIVYLFTFTSVNNC